MLLENVHIGRGLLHVHNELSRSKTYVSLWVYISGPQGTMSQLCAQYNFFIGFENIKGAFNFNLKTSPALIKTMSHILSSV